MIEKQKSFSYSLIYPGYENKVRLIITDDNRLLCSIWRNKIGRIKEDGSLELIDKEKETS